MDSNPFRSNDNGVPRWASPWGAPWASVPRQRQSAGATQHASERATRPAAHHVIQQAAGIPVARVRRSKSWRVTPRRVLATSAALSFVGAALVITLSVI